MTDSIPLPAEGEPQNVRGPAGPSPLRRPGSIRRTATVDMTWPDGVEAGLRLDGSARDAVTLDPAAPPRVTAAASTSVGVGSEREIREIRCTPAHPRIEELIGCRGGGHLRAALDDHLPGERQAGTPLYLLLDDISGTSLIAGFALSRWTTDWPPRDRRRERPSMEGICIGFRPGSSALGEIGGGPPSQRSKPVGPLPHPDDPDGWHALAELPGKSMRRARRIDVWLDDGLIRIDSGFQDSAGDPGGGRVAVHEYLLEATADARTGELLSLEADARILPFMECPSAMLTARRLIGAKLADLRTVVLETLPRTNGCTHLNDALRALAEVPVLADQLRAVTSPRS